MRLSSRIMTLLFGIILGIVLTVGGVALGGYMLLAGEGTMGKLMKDSTLYNRLNNTTDAATQLLEDLKKNPKRYVHFSVFGRKEK